MIFQGLRPTMSKGNDTQETMLPNRSGKGKRPEFQNENVLAPAPKLKSNLAVIWFACIQGLVHFVGKEKRRKETKGKE